MSVPLSSLELKMASKYPKIKESFTSMAEVPKITSNDCCFACSNKVIFCFIIATFFILFINPYIIENLDHFIKTKMGFAIIGDDDILTLKGMIIIGIIVFLLCRIILFF